MMYNSQEMSDLALITAYEDELQHETKHFQEVFRDVKKQVVDLITENKRLTAQLKESIRIQMEISNKEEQVSKNTIQQMSRQLLLESLEEKESVVEMWHLALKEIERLEQQLIDEKTRPETKLLRQQMQRIQDEHRTVISKLMAELLSHKDEQQKSNTEIKGHLFEIHKLRQEKEVAENELVKRQSQITTMLNQDRTRENEWKQLQATNESLRGRMQVANSEIAILKEANVNIENELSDAEKRVRELEEERVEIIQRAKFGVQMVENALLEKEEAFVRENRAHSEVERLQKAVAQLLDEAGASTKEKVDDVKKKCNETVEKILSEMKSLQMEVNEWQIRHDRVQREKTLVETRTELAKEEYERAEMASREYVERFRKDLFEATTFRDSALANSDELRLTAEQKINECKSMLKTTEEEKLKLGSSLREVTSRLESFESEREQFYRQIEELRAELRERKEKYDSMTTEFEKRFYSAEKEWKTEREELEVKVTVLKESAKRASEDEQRRKNDWSRVSAEWHMKMNRSNECLRKRIAELERQLTKQKERNERLTVSFDQAREIPVSIGRRSEALRHLTFES